MYELLCETDEMDSNDLVIFSDGSIGKIDGNPAFHNPVGELAGWHCEDEWLQGIIIPVAVLRWVPETGYTLMTEDSILQYRDELVYANGNIQHLPELADNIEVRVTNLHGWQKENTGIVAILRPNDVPSERMVCIDESEPMCMGDKVIWSDGDVWSVADLPQLTTDLPISLSGWADREEWEDGYVIPVAVLRPE